MNKAVLTEPEVAQTTRVKITVIVPCKNEEEGLAEVLDDLFKHIDSSYEVIVIDDGSTDRTSQVAAGYPCKVIRHEVNKGKGESIKTGLDNSEGENIIWIDADGTYPAEMIPRMVDLFKTYDMVVCSRKYGRENIPLFNRIGNCFFKTIIKSLSGFRGNDPCTGLYGVKREHLERMDLSAKRFAIESEVSMKSGKMKLKTMDIPIVYKKRLGKSNLNGIKVGCEITAKILSLLFWKPAKGHEFYYIPEGACRNHYLYK